MASSVLVIDDSAYQRGIILNLVKSEGYETLEAENGIEGYEVIMSKRPDIVLMDIVMPEMDGLSLLKKIHENNVRIPIVVISADIQESTKKECMNLGAVGFVNKPLKGDSRTTLMNILKSYLE